MNKRLTQNLSSQYFEAMNRLNSKSARRRIVAYVESYDDVLFWRTVLSRFENSSRYFEVMLPSRKTLERGKKSVLMNLLSQNAGDNMIACVDADYDYLIQGATQTSKTIISSPYVLHTYAYAIENYQCYAPSLHDVCVMVTLNDHRIFDFEEFLKQFSIAIYPLFVWSIWHYRRNIYGEFTITDFNHITEIGSFSILNPMLTIERVRRKVHNKVITLQHRHPKAKASYLELKKDLTLLGVTPETTYMYIQGHHLFNRIVLPIVNRVCCQLIQERENEIRHQAVHDTQCRNELSCYKNSIQDISQMMKKNTGYTESEQFKKILTDTEKMLTPKQSDKPQTL